MFRYSTNSVPAFVRTRSLLLMAGFAFHFAVSQHGHISAAEDPVMRTIEEAGKAGVAGDYKKAIELYTRALSSRPNDAAIYSLRGKVLTMAGDAEAAIKDFSRVIRLKPEDMGSYYNRGMLYASLDRHDEAIGDFSVVLSSNPDDHEALTHRAESQLKSGNFTACVRDADAVLSQHPDYYPARGFRALAHTELGEYEQGREDHAAFLKAASSKHKDRVYAHFGLGKCYEGLGNNEQALAEFLQCARMNPPADLLGRLAIQFQKLGQLNEAVGQYTKLIKLEPKNARAYQGRGSCLSLNGEMEKALADLNTAIQLAPHAPENWCQRAEIFRLARNVSQSHEDVLKALEIDPSNSEAYHIWARLKLGYPEVAGTETALELAEKACALTDWKDASCLDALALAYEGKGDYVTAHKWFEESMKHNPPYLLKTPAALEHKAEVARKAAATAR